MASFRWTPEATLKLLAYLHQGAAIQIWGEEKFAEDTGRRYGLRLAEGLAKHYTGLGSVDWKLFAWGGWVPQLPAEKLEKLYELVKADIAMPQPARKGAALKAKDYTQNLAGGFRDVLQAYLQVAAVTPQSPEEPAQPVLSGLTALRPVAAQLAGVLARYFAVVAQPITEAEAAMLARLTPKQVEQYLALLEDENWHELFQSGDSDATATGAPSGLQTRDGRTVRLLDLKMTHTYAGQMEGDAASGSEFTRGRLAETHPAGPGTLIIDDGRRELPAVTWTAVFESREGTQTKDSAYWSDLTVVWFTESLPTSLQSLLQDCLSQIDWAKSAREFDYTDF